MESKPDAKKVVLSYVKALDSLDYDAAGTFLSKEVRIKGPAGESFKTTKEFTDMLRQYRGKYDLKKTFADGEDVCLLYDLVTPGATVFMCSWYRVKDGRITSIQTIFDPSTFGPPPDRKRS